MRKPIDAASIARRAKKARFEILTRNVAAKVGLLNPAMTARFEMRRLVVAAKVGLVRPVRRKPIVDLMGLVRRVRSVKTLVRNEQLTVVVR